MRTSASSSWRGVGRSAHADEKNSKKATHCHGAAREHNRRPISQLCPRLLTRRGRVHDSVVLSRRLGAS